MVRKILLSLLLAVSVVAAMATVAHADGKPIIPDRFAPVAQVNR